MTFRTLVNRFKTIQQHLNIIKAQELFVFSLDKSKYDEGQCAACNRIGDAVFEIEELMRGLRADLKEGMKK